MWLWMSNRRNRFSLSARGIPDIVTIQLAEPAMKVYLKAPAKHSMF
jgi:hypothetical protein